jgi:CHASE2 domain-containing sensor protein
MFLSVEYAWLRLTVGARRARAFAVRVAEKHGPVVVFIPSFTLVGLSAGLVWWGVYESTDWLFVAPIVGAFIGLLVAGLETARRC